jgi:ankyrin repeat protein
LTLHYNFANRIPELTSLVLDLIHGPESTIFEISWRKGVFPERIYDKNTRTLEARRQTAFYNAALIGSPELLEALLDHGAEINAEGGYLGTALTAAAYHGSRQSVRFLLARGADSTINAGHQGTALHAAAAGGGWLDIMEMLIAHGADVNATGGIHGTVLSAAVETKLEAEASIRFLLKAGANPHLGDIWPTLPYAAAAGDGASIELLLDYGVDPNEHEGAALYYAVTYGHAEIARMLLAKGATSRT